METEPITYEKFLRSPFRFEWIESGEKLLSNIKSEIDESGGEKILSDLILAEFPELFGYKTHLRAVERLKRLNRMPSNKLMNEVNSSIVKLSVRPKNINAKQFKPWEEKFITDNWNKMSTIDISNKLNVTANMIYKYGKYKLNLGKKKSIISELYKKSA